MPPASSHSGVRYRSTPFYEIGLRFAERRFFISERLADDTLISFLYFISTSAIPPITLTFPHARRLIYDIMLHAHYARRACR